MMKQYLYVISSYFPTIKHLKTIYYLCTTMINVTNTQREHIITYADGSKRKANLFQTKDGQVCEYIPRSRYHGHYLDMSFIQDIQPVQKRVVDIVQKTRKFLTKVCKYLEASGLWADVLSDFKCLLNADDETLKQLLSGTLSWTEEYEMCKSIGMNLRFGGIDDLRTTVEKGIKSINYYKWGKETSGSTFARAIANKEDWSHAWHKGYDNSISCRMYNGRMIAHYSEEYKGCGNGHYYIAIDAYHAIFSEDD